MRLTITGAGLKQQGVCNVGLRPTVVWSNSLFWKLHLFNFDKDIYGQLLTVEFKKFIRNEKKFDGLDAAETTDFCRY